MATAFLLPLHNLFSSLQDLVACFLPRPDPVPRPVVRTQVQRTSSGMDKPSGQSVLTAREQDILKWIYLGKSNFEIGAILKISPLTVKNHVQKILRKLNVVNRTQAIGKALELRILNT